MSSEHISKSTIEPYYSNQARDSTIQQMNDVQDEMLEQESKDSAYTFNST